MKYGAEGNGYGKVKPGLQIFLYGTEGFKQGLFKTAIGILGFAVNQEHEFIVVHAEGIAGKMSVDQFFRDIYNREADDPQFIGIMGFEESRYIL